MVGNRIERLFRIHLDIYLLLYIVFIKPLKNIVKDLRGRRQLNCCHHFLEHLDIFRLHFYRLFHDFLDHLHIFGLYLHFFSFNFL